MDERRLFLAAVVDLGYSAYDRPRDRLWNWILHYQLPSLGKDGALWQQFFEDHDEANDRTAWAPLNLARYLLEKKDADEYKALALQALNFGTYALNTNGCPCEKAGSSSCRGGWQEDAHTDKIHNFIDAIEATKGWLR